MGQLRWAVLRQRAKTRLMVRRNTRWMDQPPTVRARTGVFMVLGVYLAYWGYGVFNAGWALTGIHPRSVQEWPRAISNVLQTWGTTGLLLAVIVASLHLVGARQAVPLPCDRAGWTVELQAGRWFLLWLIAGTVVMAMTAAVLGGQAAYPIAEHLLPADRFVTVLGGVSGAVEEPFFLAFTVVVLRRAGFGWPAVVGTSIGLRWAFHIYYGLPSVGLVVWAGGAVLVYRLTGRIIGAMLAHLLWDTMAAGFLVDWQPVAVTCGVLVLAVLILPALRRGPRKGPHRSGRSYRRGPHRLMDRR